MSDFYLTTLDGGFTVGRFTALDKLDGIVHAVSTRQGLDVAMVRNDPAAAAGRLAEALSVPRAACVEQVHGGAVLTVAGLQDGRVGAADGLATVEAGVGLMVRGADCPLILAADGKARVVAVAHASWRGTVAQIAGEMVRRMVALGAAPERIVAAICPSAGPCCYEVGQDVFDAMAGSVGPRAARFFSCGDNKMRLDLWAANTDQLVCAGLQRSNVHVSGVCTICSKDGLFPSHRREGLAAGRFAAMIAVKD